MTHRMDIEGYALLYAGEAIAPSSSSYAFVSGYQNHGRTGDTDRWVDLSVTSREAYATPSMHVAVHLSPDEARGLAARLLDAADDADENLDAPVDLVPTGRA